MNLESRYGAARAIDLQMSTESKTTIGQDGKAWIKVKFDKLSCIRRVTVHLKSDGSAFITWTCTGREGKLCSGNNIFIVSIERTRLDGPSDTADCKYGDIVKLEGSYGGALEIYEIAIIGKQG